MQRTKSRQKAGRRQFLAASLLTAGTTPVLTASIVNFSGSITGVEGIRVGHFADKRRPTGCTVLIFDRGAVAGVDVRGSAPGTRETDLLNPINTVQQVNAIVLSGGSAFGLAAADGVVRYLEERHLGFVVGNVVIPIVPAAVLYDLDVGDPGIRPDAEAGYQACLAAGSGPVQEGNVGAGAGATVGKMFGHKRAMKSGLGTAAVQIPGTGLVVGAIIAVNAVGDVRDPRSGAIIAGARTPDGKASPTQWRRFSMATASNCSPAPIPRSASWRQTQSAPSRKRQNSLRWHTTGWLAPLIPFTPLMTEIPCSPRVPEQTKPRQTWGAGSDCR